MATHTKSALTAGPSYFYPRHPRGWRRAGAGPLWPFCNFYPRHPRGWRHPADVYEGTPLDFYPRHPRGWRPSRGSTAFLFSKFLSTPPSRVATERKRSPANRYRQFLSTPPSRVATKRRKSARLSLEYFYPRHPRGWRLSRTAKTAARYIFLSTPPSRVATVNGLINGMQYINFYPRHPRGWRPGAYRLKSERSYISIHATLAGGDH